MSVDENREMDESRVLDKNPALDKNLALDRSKVTEEKSPGSSPDFIPQRFWDLIVNPRGLMENVGRWPKWWIAGLLILILNGVATTWEGPILLKEYREQPGSALMNTMITQEDLLEKLEESVGEGKGNKLSSVISSGMNTWGGTLVFSLFLGFFAKMAGGKGRFSQALGIVHWAALIPYGIGTLVRLALILNTGHYARISLSPAIFLPSESVGTFAFIFLDSFTDLTVIWGLIVVVIGFGKVFKMDYSPAALSVFMPWALITAIMAGFRLMVGV